MSTFHLLLYVTTLVTPFLSMSSGLAVDINSGDNERISITSENGLYQFQAHHNGSFVLYHTSDPDTALWSSGLGTAQEDTAFIARMKANGNFEIYSDSQTARDTPDSGSGIPGNGNPNVCSDTLYGGDKLGSITSVNGQFRLLADNDGCLVLLNMIASNNRTLWVNCLCSEYSDVTLVMQTDGNLVKFQYGHICWQTSTGQYPGSRLVLQNDGNLVVYTPLNQAVWASSTDLADSQVAESLQKYLKDHDRTDDTDFLVYFSLVAAILLYCSNPRYPA